MSHTPSAEFKDGFYPARNCSICEATIGYVVKSGLPYYDSHCDCMSYRIEEPRPVTDEEFQDYLSKQRVNDN